MQVPDWQRMDEISRATDTAATMKLNELLRLLRGDEGAAAPVQLLEGGEAGAGNGVGDGEFEKDVMQLLHGGEAGDGMMDSEGTETAKIRVESEEAVDTLALLRAGNAAGSVLR